MTLPSDSRKLDDNEIYSINNAVKEAGIVQIHPDKMEAFAEHLVQQLKQEQKPSHTQPKPWRTGGPLEE